MNQYFLLNPSTLSRIVSPDLERNSIFQRINWFGMISKDINERIFLFINYTLPQHFLFCCVFSLEIENCQMSNVSVLRSIFILLRNNYGFFCIVCFL